MKRFKYDVIKLIEGVKSRPCLWDKHIENYKDRVERKTAWNEIFNTLDEQYETMPAEEKRVIEEIVQTKWTNIRDTFVKSLRIKAGKQKKRYVLHDHLKFLMRFMPESERQDDAQYYQEDDSFKKEEPDVSNRFQYTGPKNYEFYEESLSGEEIIDDVRHRRKKAKVESHVDDSNNIDFVSVDAVNDPRIMNEDEAFFASLLPTVVKYNEDERLEFRIEVLALMKRIKDKRN